MSLEARRRSRIDVLITHRRGWALSGTLGLVILGLSPWTTHAWGDGPPKPPTASSEGPKAQVASAPHETKADQRRPLDTTPLARSLEAGAFDADPIARARQVIADCRIRYQGVEDYTCTFFKRERVAGKLYTQHIIAMKARTKPSSLYFKFLQPNAGREAIFVHGRNNDKIVAHDVGLARVVAGTMHLDPKGGMAMEENRHPVTEAGMGSMIDTVKERWDNELHPGESVLLFHPQAKVGDRSCLMIESSHPNHAPEFLFHKVKLYIDRELGLPIRFEAYDWPSQPGVEPELMEEYTYVNLKLNVGLKDRDFDPKNAQYSYGRF